MATGKSFCASGGKKTSTAFLGNGWFPVGGVPTSMMCSWNEQNQSQTYRVSGNVWVCFSSNSYFSSCLSSHSKAEQSWLFGVALHLKLCKASGVSFDGLWHLPVHWIQLHGSNHTVLLQKKVQKHGEMEKRPQTAEFVLGVGSQGFSTEQYDFISISQGCIWRSTQHKQNLSSNWHPAAVRLPAQKCQWATATSAWRLFGSWWSDSLPGWSDGQRLWLVESHPPCSNGRPRCLWPGQRCWERSTSRRSHRLSWCEPSSCSSSQCWKSAESLRLQKRMVTVNKSHGGRHPTTPRITPKNRYQQTGQNMSVPA